MSGEQSEIEIIVHFKYSPSQIYNKRYFSLIIIGIITDSHISTTLSVN